MCGLVLSGSLAQFLRAGPGRGPWPSAADGCCGHCSTCPPNLSWPAWHGQERGHRLRLGWSTAWRRAVAASRPWVRPRGAAGAGNTRDRRRWCWRTAPVLHLCKPAASKLTTPLRLCPLGDPPAATDPSSTRIRRPTRPSLHAALGGSRQPPKPSSVSQAAGAAIVDHEPAAWRSGPTATPAGSHVIRDRSAGAISSAPRRKRLSAVLGMCPTRLDIPVRHRCLRHRTLAGVGASTPKMMPMAVVLLARLGPTKPKSWPSRTVKEVIEGDQVAVAAGQTLQIQHVTPPHCRS